MGLILGTGCVAVGGMSIRATFREIPLTYLDFETVPSLKEVFLLLVLFNIVHKSIDDASCALLIAIRDIPDGGNQVPSRDAKSAKIPFVRTPRTRRHPT